MAAGDNSGTPPPSLNKNRNKKLEERDGQLDKHRAWALSDPYQIMDIYYYHSYSYLGSPSA